MRELASSMEEQLVQRSSAQKRKHLEAQVDPSLVTRLHHK